MQPGWPDMLTTRQLRLRATAGTVVVVLSPLLTPEITTVMVALAQRGLSVVCVDTLSDDTVPEPALDPDSAARLAWRMRLLERRDAGHRGDPAAASRSCSGAGPAPSTRCSGGSRGGRRSAARCSR